MVTAARAEDVVRDRILTALDSPEFVAALITAAGGGDDADDTAAQLRAIEARRVGLAATWAAGDITRKEWLTAREALNTAADQLTSRARPHLARPRPGPVRHHDR